MSSNPVNEKLNMLSIMLIPIDRFRTGVPAEVTFSGFLRVFLSFPLKVQPDNIQDKGVILFNYFDSY